MDSCRIHPFTGRWIMVPAFAAVLFGGIAFAAKPAKQRANRTETRLFVAPGQFAPVGPGLTILTGAPSGALAAPVPGVRRFGAPAPWVVAPLAPQVSAPGFTPAQSFDRCLVSVPDVDPRFVVSPRVTDDQMIVAPRVVGLPAKSAR